VLKRIKQLVLLSIAVWFLTACDDKAIINIYDKNIPKTPIPCLKLTVLPPNSMIQTTMERLYPFTENCPYHLDISYKNGITCNSTQNVQTKCINGFPSSYLNMEVRKGFSLKYSYYIDLKSDVTREDVEKGFERLKEDLNLER